MRSLRVLHEPAACDKHAGAARRKTRDGRMTQPKDSTAPSHDQPPAAAPSGALSAGKAFFVVMALLGSAGLVLSLGQRDPSIERSLSGSLDSKKEGAENSTADKKRAENTRSADVPSRGRAKREFRRLNRMFQALYATRNLQGLDRIFLPDSPMKRRVSKELQELRDQGVVVRTDFKTLDLKVRSVSQSRIELTQVVRVDPKFLSEQGEDITSSNAVDIDTVEWVLQRRRHEWFLKNAVVVARKQQRPKSRQ